MFERRDIIISKVNFMKHNDIVVFYHKDCFDGFGAAYAAWKKFKNKAVYVPLGHHSKAVNISGKNEIYFVDFSYPKNIIDKIIKNNKKVTVIDHHISNEKVVKSLKYNSFDNNHSGAVLTWKYFHTEKPVPKLLLYIEDRDLWNFKVPLTKEIMAAIALRDLDFRLWDKIVEDLENKEKRKKYIKEGKIVLKYQNKLIGGLVDKSDKAQFEGRNALVVNSSVLASEVGNALVKKGADIGIIWNQKARQTHISLRSDKKGKIDLSKIAQKYGGAGHKSAVGIILDASNPFPWKIIK